jgi:peptidyl-dipeptidase A
MSRIVMTLLCLLVSLSLTTCRQGASSDESGGASDVSSFLERANRELLRLSNEDNQAGWVAATYITPDTEALSARASEAYVAAQTRYAKEAAAFGSAGTPEQQRQLTVLKNLLTVAAPSDDGDGTELSKLLTSMEAAYGRGKWCPAQKETEDGCLDVEEITEIMANSRDPQRLRDVWEGWRTISPPYRNDYVRFVELSNKGAKELGFADTGAMWRSRYDMAPDEFAKELERLWEQLRPLYVSLHTFVRARLRAKYGEHVPGDGPIPAHLLGNIWAQDWSNVYDLVAPPRRAGNSGGGQGAPADRVPLGDILRARRISAVDMVRYGERFFTSLGFEPLPQTFWERSLFVKPRDREVLCHASAWDVDNVDDLRIKMCIDQTGEDFTTIHHELGHNFYQRAYNTLPISLRESANDGFHEAIGDTIALSVTPEYLVQIGLLDKAPDASGDIALLLERALEKVAFLPFALVVDEWRWRVFSGEVPASAYNKAWWELRQRFQGVSPPAPRGEEFFDAGAKMHVPANVPYMRYFLAAILQFQFHRELSKVAGCTTALHRCSIYGSKEAGRRLQETMALGASRPWPDALEALTGSRQMDATAIADYFAPLKSWLDEQNAAQTSGW